MWDHILLSSSGDVYHNYYTDVGDLVTLRILPEVDPWDDTFGREYSWESRITWGVWNHAHVDDDSIWF